MQFFSCFHFLCRSYQLESCDQLTVFLAFFVVALCFPNFHFEFFYFFDFFRFEIQTETHDSCNVELKMWNYRICFPVTHFVRRWTYFVLFFKKNCLFPSFQVGWLILFRIGNGTISSYGVMRWWMNRINTKPLFE